MNIYVLFTEDIHISPIYGVKLLVFTWKKSYSYHKWKKSNCKVPMHAMKAHWRSGGRAALIPTPLLDWGEWSALCPGSITPRERDPATHCIGGWVAAGLVDTSE